MFQNIAMNKPLIVIFVVLLLSGCTSIKAVFAMMRSTEHFVSIKEHPSIKHEKGAESLARLISLYLDSSIHVIERKQGKFTGSVEVYIPRSIESFSKYCASERPSACVIGHRLFMSPKLLKEKERIPGILTHELSHLQLTQAIGRWNYQTKLPAWFKEGLAVFVSNGAGAENVDEETAISAIINGKSIRPNGGGGLLIRKTASSFGLKPHMFYRQGSMYVRWLYGLGQNKFRELIESLKGNHTLEEAMLEAYSFSVNAGWEQYLSELKHNNRIHSNSKKRRSSVSLLPVMRSVSQ